MHRITDVRMGGISRRSFGTLRKMCGDNTLKNVAIVLNMWDTVNSQVADAREKELEGEDIFFKGAIDKGARILRHSSTIDSGLSILRHIVGLNTPPPLQIQEEIVDRNLDLSQTAATLELHPELRDQALRHAHDIKILREEAKTVIAACQDKNNAELRKIQAETSQLSVMVLEAEAKYREDMSQREQEIQNRAERERLQAEKAEIETQALRDRLANEEIRSSEKVEGMRRRLVDAECRVRLKHG